MKTGSRQSRQSRSGLGSALRGNGLTINERTVGRPTKKSSPMNAALCRDAATSTFYPVWCCSFVSVWWSTLGVELFYFLARFNTNCPERRGHKTKQAGKNSRQNAQRARERSFRIATFCASWRQSTFLRSSLTFIMV